MPDRLSTHDDVKLLATRAKAVLEALFNDLADFPAPSDRPATMVGLPLLRSSIECGRAIISLLEAEPLDLAGPAHALYRVQLEHYVRGAYFGDLATKSEIAAFMRNGSVPIRRDPRDGQRKRIHFKIWHAEVHEALGLPPKHGLGIVVRTRWDQFNGMVHGGTQVLYAYTRDYPEIAFSMEAKAQVWLLEAVLTTAYHAAAFHLRVAMVPTATAEPMFEAAIRRKQAYEAARRQLVAQ